MDHDLAVAVDLGQPLRHFVHGDQLAADVGDLVLEGLAHVEDEEIFAGVEALLEFLHADLGNAVLHCLFLLGFGRDAAELLVVDELGHGGVVRRRRGTRDSCAA